MLLLLPLVTYNVQRNLNYNYMEQLKSLFTTITLTLQELISNDIVYKFT